MASLTGQLVAETYKALLKTIDNDILTASEKQITDGLGGGSNVFIDSQGFLRANKYKVTNGLATQFLKADGSLDANTYLTGITSSQIITALGYTPVTNARTLTINGTTYDLSANRSWTVAGTAAVWGNITGTLSNQTDLQTALNAKFNNPTGTISQYIRGDGSLATFPTLPGGLPTGGTSGQILAKIDATDYNAHWIDNFATQTKNEVKLGATLAKGTAVYVSGSTGGSGTNMIVMAASNASEALSSKTFGLLETGGATNDFVKCVTFGLIAGLDTSTATAGDPVWLGVNGALLFGLANKPVAPANMVYIGVVTRVQSNNGEIFVNVQNGFEIEELHDVYITDPANNHGLFYDLATDLWKNKSIAGALGYTPQAQLSGTGFVKASGTTISYDNSTYLTTTDAASTYQRLDRMAINLLASDIQYPNNNAVIAALALKANAANPEFTGNMTISGAEPKLFFTDTDNNPDYTVFIDSGIFYIYDQTAGTTRFSISSTGNISAGVGKSITAGSFVKESGLATQFLKADGSIDSSTYVTSTALADYLLITTAASTYQRLDRIASSLFASATNYPNNNAVIAGLALKADAANPVFTGSMNIQGLESRINFYDENNLRKFFIGYDSGQLSIYQDAGSATRFQINSSGNITTGVNNTITSWGFIKDGGTSSQYLMADGSVSTLANPVTGSGTTNYIPKWTSASAIGNSIVSDNGTILNVAGGINAYGGSGGIKSALYYRNTWNDTQYPTLYSTGTAEFIMLHLPHLPYLQNGTYGYTAGTYGSIVRHAGQPTVTSFWDSGILGLQGITDAYGISRNDGAPFFYIASTGNVGIGTASPSSYTNLIALTINGASGSVIDLKTNGTLYGELYSLANEMRIDAVGASTTLKLLTNSVPRLTIFSNGNTFIGSSAIDSGYKLDVNGTTRFSGNTTIGIAAAATNVKLIFNGVASKAAGIEFQQSGSPQWYIGNGIASEDNNFELYNSNGTMAMKIIKSTNAINFQGSATFSNSITAGSTITAGTTIGGLSLNITGTQSTFRIASNYTGGGDLLSGTLMYLDDVTNNNLTIIPSSSGTNGSKIVAAAFNGSAWRSIWEFANVNSGNPNLILVKSGGNVIIGTTTDSGYKLRVNGTGFFDGAIGANGGAGGGASINLFYKTTWGGTQYPTIYGGSTAEFFMMHLPHVPYLQTGVNGYSGANYGSLVRFAGQAAATSYWDAGVGACGVGVDKFVIGRNESALFTITNGGNVTATAFFESSDSRLKKLIDGSAQIAGIENLQAKLYEKNGKLEFGYFAQDAEKFMPYAVEKNADGFLSLSYREVHTAKIARLEKRVAELEKQLNLN